MADLTEGKEVVGPRPAYFQSLREIDDMLRNGSISDVRKVLRSAENELNANKTSLLALMGTAYPQILRIVSTACSLHVTSQNVAGILEDIKHTQVELQAVLTAFSPSEPCAEIPDIPEEHRSGLIGGCLRERAGPDASERYCRGLREWLHVSELWAVALSYSATFQLSGTAQPLPSRKAHQSVLQSYSELSRRIVELLFAGRPLPALYMLCVTGSTLAACLSSSEHWKDPTELQRLLHRHDVYCTSHRLFARTRDMALQCFSNPLPSAALLQKPFPNAKSLQPVRCACSLCRSTALTSTFPSTTMLFEALSVLYLCTGKSELELMRTFTELRHSLMTGLVKSISSPLFPLLEQHTDHTAEQACELLSSTMSASPYITSGECARAAPLSLQHKAVTLAYRVASLLHVVDTSVGVLHIFATATPGKWRADLCRFFSPLCAGDAGPTDSSPCSCAVCAGKQADSVVLHLWTDGSRPPVSAPPPGPANSSQPFARLHKDAQTFVETWKIPVVNALAEGIKLLFASPSSDNAQGPEELETPDSLVVLDQLWRMVLTLVVSYRLYDVSSDPGCGLLLSAGGLAEDNADALSPSSRLADTASASVASIVRQGPGLIGLWRNRRKQRASWLSSGTAGTTPGPEPSETDIESVLDALYNEWVTALLAQVHRVSFATAMRFLWPQEAAVLSEKDISLRLLTFDKELEQLFRLVEGLGDGPGSQGLASSRLLSEPTSSFVDLPTVSPTKPDGPCALSPSCKARAVMEGLLEAVGNAMTHAETAVCRDRASDSFPRHSDGPFAGASTAPGFPLPGQLFLLLSVVQCLDEKGWPSAERRGIAELRLGTLHRVASDLALNPFFSSTRRTYQDLAKRMQALMRHYFHLYWTQGLNKQLSSLREDIASYVAQHPLLIEATCSLPVHSAGLHEDRCKKMDSSEPLTGIRTAQTVSHTVDATTTSLLATGSPSETLGAPVPSGEARAPTTEHSVPATTLVEEPVPAPMTEMLLEHDSKADTHCLSPAEDPDTQADVVHRESEPFQHAHSPSKNVWAPARPLGSLVRFLCVSGFQFHRFVDVYAKHFQPVVPQYVWESLSSDLFQGLASYILSSTLLIYKELFHLDPDLPAKTGITAAHAAQALVDLAVLQQLIPDVKQSDLRYITSTLRERYVRDIVDKTLLNDNNVQGIAYAFLLKHLLLFSPFIHTPLTSPLLQVWRTNRFLPGSPESSAEDCAKAPPIRPVPSKLPFLRGPLPSIAKEGLDTGTRNAQRVLGHRYGDLKSAGTSATTFPSEQYAKPKLLISPSRVTSPSQRSLDPSHPPTISIPAGAPSPSPRSSEKDMSTLSQSTAVDFGSSAYRNVSTFSSFLRGHVEGLSTKVSEVMKQRHASTGAPC